MRKLKDEGEDEKYTLQFGEYEKAGVEADDLEELYESVHEKIRADPSFVSDNYSKPASVKGNKKKISLSQRKGRIAQKKAWKEWRDNQGDEEAM
jgi:large subunit ribosomal protein L5e